MSRLSLVLCALGVLLAGFLGRLPDGRSEPPGKKKTPPATKGAPKAEPAKAKKTPKAEPARTARPNVPLRNKLAEIVNMPSGSMGWGARRSRATNASNAAIPTTTDAVTSGSLHPRR